MGAIVTAGFLASVGATPAGATVKSGQRIANLALANMGRHACSHNSLGGRAYGSSCTGNGGRPEYWCADFAKWVWQHSGVARTYELTPAAGSFYDYGLRNGTLTGTPAVGDVAVFNYYGGGVAEHVAVVTAVNPDGTIETTSGDWGGRGGTEAQFSSTSTVVLNSPAYVGAIGKVPWQMGMVLSAFVAPVGVHVTPIDGATAVQDGALLSPGDTLTSPNGLFTLGLTTTGNLIEQQGSRVLWQTTGALNQPGDEAVLQSDGNFVLYTPTDRAVWSTGTSGNAGDSFSIRDDGSLAVTDAHGQVVWSRAPAVQQLSTGVSLLPGQMLVAESGLYQLNMQADGNLVEYSAGRPLWFSKTAHHAGAHAVVSASGKLAIVTRSGKVLKAFGRPAPHSRAVLVPTGALVLQSGSSIRWSNGA